MTGEYVIIFSTCAHTQEAESIAGSLLSQNLAACVNIADSVVSFFRWKDRQERTSEVLLVIKTRRDLFDAVRRVIRESHSYDVPEVVAIPIIDGDEDYLNWMSGQLSRDD